MEQDIMDEDEYYASDEHLKTEESYNDYLKGKKEKDNPKNFGGVF